VEPFIPTFKATSPQNELAFRCKTSMPAKYRGYVFDIAWYINNNQVALKERIPYTSLNTDGVLHRLDWDPGLKAKIGFRVIHALLITVKPVHAVFSIKQSHVLKDCLFLVLLRKILYELNLF